MKKVAEYAVTMKTAASWLDQEVVNSETGNKVKVRSLPKEQRERYKPK